MWPIAGSGQKPINVSGRGTLYAVFGADQLAELARGHDEIQGKHTELQKRYIGRNYRNKDAREFAIHGFGRRLGTLVRCIDRVFEILPPDREDVPSCAEVNDATINIQAFVFNIFGCWESLAWMWVCEKEVTGKNGQRLAPKLIGLGERQGVRRSLSTELNSYLDSRQDWFKQIKDFRDELAHRIPLCIPPYLILPSQEDEYRRLEMAADDALHCGNLAGYHQLTEDQKKLRTFQPIMIHSLVRNSDKVVRFHFQMLLDFNIVDEIGRKMLEEMER
jgi:hypothetical protein